MLITLRNSSTPEELVGWLIWHLQCLKDGAEQNQEFASVKEIYLKVDEALKTIVARYCQNEDGEKDEL